MHNTINITQHQYPLVYSNWRKDPVCATWPWRGMQDTELQCTRHRWNTTHKTLETVAETQSAILQNLLHDFYCLELSRTWQHSEYDDDKKTKLGLSP
jgi:hypothetical protein